MADLWLPGAERRLIPIGENDPRIQPVGDVFHIAVTNAESLWHIFTDGRGIESTGYIRKDGSVEQYRPYNVECDAQAAGNSWFSGGTRVGLCSWETMGDCSTDWTPEQVATIKTIIAMRHREWGVPLRMCPTANSSGFGYHRLHDGWNPNHHSCPCDSRVRQWNNVVLPWMNQGAPGEGDWFDMATEADLRKIIREEVGSADIVADLGKPGGGDSTIWSLNRVLRALLNDEQHIRRTIHNSTDRVIEAVLAEVPAEGGGLTRAQVVNAVERGVRNVLLEGVAE